MTESELILVAALLALAFLHTIIVCGMCYIFLLFYGMNRWLVVLSSILVIVLAIGLNIFCIREIRVLENPIWQYLYLSFDIAVPVVIVPVSFLLFQSTNSKHIKFLNQYFFLLVRYKSYAKNPPRNNAKFLSDAQFEKYVLIFRELVEKIEEGEKFSEIEKWIMLDPLKHDFRGEVRFNCPNCHNHFLVLDDNRRVSLYCNFCFETVHFERFKDRLLLVVAYKKPFFVMTDWNCRSVVYLYNLMSFLAEMNENCENAMIYLTQARDLSEKYKKKYPENDFYQNFIDESFFRLIELKLKFEKEKELLSKK